MFLWFHCWTKNLNAYRAKTVFANGKIGQKIRFTLLPDLSERNHSRKAVKIGFLPLDSWQKIKIDSLQNTSSTSFQLSRSIVHFCMLVDLRLNPHQKCFAVLASHKHSCANCQACPLQLWSMPRLRSWQLRKQYLFWLSQRRLWDLMRSPTSASMPKRVERFAVEVCLVHWSLAPRHTKNSSSLFLSQRTVGREESQPYAPYSW